METFNFCLRPKLNVETQVQRNVVKFGDGYSQRSRKNVNPLLRIYPISVKVRNEQRLEVEHFLARHAGVEPFGFNDPYTGEYKKVVCGKWQVTMGQTYTEFNCEFEEVP